MDPKSVSETLNHIASKLEASERSNIDCVRSDLNRVISSLRTASHFGGLVLRSPRIEHRISDMQMGDVASVSSSGYEEGKCDELIIFENGFNLAYEVMSSGGKIFEARLGEFVMYFVGPNEEDVLKRLDIADSGMAEKIEE